jgi:hypothetical protein
VNAAIICFSCEAITRGRAVDAWRHWELAIRCSCGSIPPWEFRRLRAEMNAIALAASGDANP